MRQILAVIATGASIDSENIPIGIDFVMNVTSPTKQPAYLACEVVLIVLSNAAQDRDCRKWMNQQSLTYPIFR